MTQRISSLFAILLSGFLIYTVALGQFSLALQRGLPLALSSAIIFLASPIVPRGTSVRGLYIVGRFIDIMFAIGIMISIGYSVHFEDQIALRFGFPSDSDVVVAAVGVLCVLEACRRAAPVPLTIVIAGAVGYVLWGQYLPGDLGHSGYSVGYLMQYLFFSNEGIFGFALATMVNFIFIFFVLSTFLSATGAGEAMIHLALALTGRLKGGPALASVIASAMFGTISGSGSSNVLATGTFTIPLMRKVGYEKNYAGAIEATASTGGTILPPVMSAAAFVMAEMLGIPYIQVCLMAAIPALLYYLAIFLAVFLRAHKQNLDALTDREVPGIWAAFREGGVFLLSIGLLVGLLIWGYSPPFACFYSIVSVFLITLIKKKHRKTTREYVGLLVTSGSESTSLFASMAAIGVLIGIVSMTGIGIKFTLLITSLAGNNLFLALLVTMVATLILSMGMPTLPSYILVVIITGKALQSLGIDLFAAHLFVLYFASMSCITPPVALAAYCAAGVSGGDSMRISFYAVRLGIVGFLVPFYFALDPSLLFIGPLSGTLLAALKSTAAVVALAAALEGYFCGRLHIISRIAVVVAAGAFLVPGNLAIVAGSAAAVAAAVAEYLSRRVGSPAF